MRDKELFNEPIVLNKYGTITKTEDPENPFVGYTIIVYGATYRTFSFGGGEVAVATGGEKVEGSLLIPGQR